MSKRVGAIRHVVERPTLGRSGAQEKTRQYAILVYEPPEDFGSRVGTPAAEHWPAWKAYAAALTEAGVPTGGAALQGIDTATTVRNRDGRQVQDGPYADTKEQLGGFCLIDIPDLDAALQWANRCPAAATGSVEVRPLLDMGRTAETLRGTMLPTPGGRKAGFEVAWLRLAPVRFVRGLDRRSDGNGTTGSGLRPPEPSP